MALDDLRRNDMMTHLLDSLDAGKDIGHYGRLVFAMVARHFMDDDERVGCLTKDPDFDEKDARTLVARVKARDYDPPKRERILEWRKERAFPIRPNRTPATSTGISGSPTASTRTSRSITRRRRGLRESYLGTRGVPR